MRVVAAAVLAAGAGTRMGRAKAEIVVDGSRLLERAVRAARDAGCDPVFAVVRGDTAVAGVTTIVNPDPARGQRSSLELAVAAAAAGGVAALAVVLVDTPGVGADAIAAVVEGWRPGRIAVANYDGTRGHPTVMSPRLWAEGLALARPDEGAKTLLARRRDLVDAVDTPGDPTDLDTPDDLERWTAEH